MKHFLILLALSLCLGCARSFSPEIVIKRDMANGRFLRLSPMDVVTLRERAGERDVWRRAGIRVVGEVCGTNGPAGERIQLMRDTAAAFLRADHELIQTIEGQLTPESKLFWYEWQKGDDVEEGYVAADHRVVTVRLKTGQSPIGR